MRFEPFSPRQALTLTWWMHPAHRGRDAVICDGAVRSGKTLCLSLSFVLWALACHPGATLALCGKTILSLERNVVHPLLALLGQAGIPHRYFLSRRLLEVGARTPCRFYLYGGRDEGSAAAIQGVTLNGILLDEVALMPRSFVEQALARCSAEGSRFFFSCNPQHPHHWFYREWILKARERNALYLHFSMEDNPGLSPAVLARYQSLYSGAFYQRFVLGRWVAAQGAVYPMFGPGNQFEEAPVCTRYVISCDYGTVNPCSMGLWGEGEEGIWYRLREYYHSGRETGTQKTDEEYADALETLAGGLPLERVLVDPSAASFIQCLRRRGIPAAPAQNQVLGGIRVVAAALQARRIKIHCGCKDTLREFALYRWREEGDVPVKEDDHAMDDIRYFALGYLSGEEPGFWAGAAPRRGQ